MTAHYRVLVVEDDEDSREAVIEVLEILGHEATGASNAIGALRVAKADRPDVALVDVVLPDASGFDLARGLRALLAPVRIRLIVTAAPSPC